ncbi:hypothetical protein WIS52_18575 [Pseudonocardia nematodicida]|uniref:Uncharacterized protein n=1 Tax=Pseudonocardia nematodicida TaxID=1206997 RepID=A0ABV1KF19_9PSEU
MNDYRIQVGGLTGGSILLPLLLLPAGLSIVTSLVITVILLVSVIVYSVVRKPPPEPARTLWPDPPQPPREPAPPPRPPAPTTFPATVSLPSSRPDYRFAVSATVAWEPMGDRTDHDDRDALAHTTFVARAASITARFSLVDWEEAEQALRAELGAPKQDESHTVHVSASDISLSTDEKDVDRVRSIETLRKQKEHFEYRREHEKAVRTYLGGDALISPGSTLIWWLTRNLDRPGDAVQQAVERIPTFARISAAAQDSDDPSAYPPPVDPRDDDAGRVLFEEALPDDDEDRFLAQYLARTADEHGRSDFGDRIRRAYRLQDLDDVADSTQSVTSARDGAGEETVGQEDPEAMEPEERGAPSDEHGGVGRRWERTESPIDEPDDAPPPEGAG